ncbi:MAG: methyltransferase domain-containing protein [Actinobacteria bacterium]|nr:methyltransferase domain-containing protein [Actinomycetota bacterium]
MRLETTVAHMTTAAQRWREDLAAWAIPPEILAQAPESPWIHPVAMFTVDRAISDSPSHMRARECLRAGESVLDIGCGGGRAAMALVPPAAHVIGVDHQAGMLEHFAAAAVDRGASHEEVLGDWPESSPRTPMADVVVCHHVAYNVADVVPFLAALTAHARRRVVVEIPTTHPLSSMAPLWRQFWDLQRPVGPTAEDLLHVAREAGIDASMHTWIDESFSATSKTSAEEQARFMRIRLCLEPGREPEIAAAMAAAGPPPARETATLWWDV